jgi:RNA polymerase sigma factor (sigma-70 family)
MRIDLLLQNPQLIPDADHLVKENIERNFFGLQCRIGRMKNRATAMPARGELVDHCRWFFITHPFDDSFDGFLDELLERGFQAVDRDRWFGGSNTTERGINRAQRVIKTNFGRALGNRFYRSNTILRMFHPHSDSQASNIHLSVVNVRERALPRKCFAVRGRLRPKEELISERISGDNKLVLCPGQVQGFFMPTQRQSDSVGIPDSPVFATTHWSVVLAAGSAQSPSSASALEQLCRVYWYPLYAFIRRKGHTPHDAQDLTQAFFARLLEKNYVVQADRERGRFRTYLLAALTHFLSDEWNKAQRLKRGGGREIISFDAGSAEDRYRLEPIDQLDASKLYERRWVTTLFENVLARLEEEFRESGKKELFNMLKSSLLAEPNESSYAEIGGRLKLTESTVKQTVHRMRLRYREVFREEIAQTVDGPGEVEDELKHIFAVLSA